MIYAGNAPCVADQASRSTSALMLSVIPPRQHRQTDKKNDVTNKQTRKCTKCFLHFESGYVVKWAPAPPLTSGRRSRSALPGWLEQLSKSVRWQPAAVHRPCRRRPD